MSIRGTIEEFRVAAENRGFELVSEKYIDNKTKLTMKDNDGYLYSANIISLQRRKADFSKFDVSNTHTIYNIKHFLKINYPDFELITDKYTHCSQSLILQTKEKYKCITTTSLLTRGIKPVVFMPNNPYIIENIKILISINLPNFELLSNKYENKYDTLTLRDEEEYYYASYLKVIRENSTPPLGLMLVIHIQSAT